MCNLTLNSFLKCFGFFLIDFRVSLRTTPPPSCYRLSNDIFLSVCVYPVLLEGRRNNTILREFRLKPPKQSVHGKHKSRCL